MLPALLKNIQSGRTGYAWLIDQNGIFLYHPHAEYVGRDAFSVRQEKFPNVAYEPINIIQKEKMLKGEQGTGVAGDLFVHLPVKLGSAATGRQKNQRRCDSTPQRPLNDGLARHNCPAVLM